MSQGLLMGKEALRQGRYSDAIQWLESFCQESANPLSPEVVQAQMGLARAYEHNGQADQAKTLYQHLRDQPNPQIQAWAEKALQQLTFRQQGAHAQHTATAAAASEATVQLDPPQAPASGDPSDHSPLPAEGLGARATSSSAELPLAATAIPADPPSPQAASRSPQAGVKIPITSSAGRLDLALYGTLGVIGILLLVVIFRHFPGFFQVYRPLPKALITLSLTANLAVLAYWGAPLLLDTIQSLLYQTRWVSISEIERYSPEAVRLIRRICTQKNLKQPQLGVINDPIPVAFAYGSQADNARLVVSQGVFKYLEEDEIATVYAHELGRILHRDLLGVTVASFPALVFYWIYATTTRLGEGKGKRGRKDLIGHVAPLAYLLYLVGSYPLFYLSRVGTYYADHFAAEATGNPNGLSRALVKLAHGTLQERKGLQQANPLLEGTRFLGITDPKTAYAAGTAYQAAADPLKMGRVFLWDLVNPWAEWMQVNSTHPLPGRRIRVLALYAERLGLNGEYEMSQVAAEGRKLDQRQLRATFLPDLLFYAAEVVGLLAGWLVGLILYLALFRELRVIFGAMIVGFGLGMIIKSFFLFPNPRSAAETDILTLMSDPYASPVRSKPVRFTGELFGRGKVGYQLGSELKLQDATGMIPLRFTSRFGPLGNLFSGMKAIRPLVGSEVVATGWLRRGIAPWLDLSQAETSGKTARSHPRVWLCIFGALVILSGILVALYLPAYWPRIPNPLQWLWRSPY
jgi:Zn-dependent protease with chaperone function